MAYFFAAPNTPVINQPPAWDVDTPSTLSFDSSGGVYNFGAKAADPQPWDVLTFAVLQTLPSGYSFNNATGVLTVANNSASAALTIRAMDSESLYADHSVNVQIQGVAGTQWSDLTPSGATWMSGYSGSLDLSAYHPTLYEKLVIDPSSPTSAATLAAAGITLDDATDSFYYSGAVGSGTFSVVVDAQPLTVVVPGQVTGLTATAVSEAQIDLTWDNLTGETGYRVERSDNGTSGWTQRTTTAADVTSYHDTGLTASTPYFYRVRAYNTAGDGTYSEVKSATTQSASVSGIYSTTFALTENPINEVGKWVNGQANGLLWSNVQTTGGIACGSRRVDENSVPRYADPIAHLSTSYMTVPPDQYAQGVVSKVPGYSAQHEVELLLRFQITANNARGYEVLWGATGYIAIVKWNGPLGNFTALYDPGSGPVPQDGDVLKAEIIGNNIKVYVNGSQIASVTDSTFDDGQPGVGFWPTPGSTLTSYGWKDVIFGLAQADWIARSQAPGVIFAHDFMDSANELEYFVRYRPGDQSDMISTNPDPTTSPNPLRLVDYGTYKAIRSRAAGTSLLADVPSVPKGTTQTIQVNDASLFPAPVAPIGNYDLFIGTIDPRSGAWDYQIFERVQLMARDTTSSPNTLTIKRTTSSNSFKINFITYSATDPNAPPIPGSTGWYRIGYTNSGSWNRPMCAFPAGQNGRLTADYGLNPANTQGARKSRTWNHTRNGPGHMIFREGYWGAKHYWDPGVGPALYKDWTPTYTGDGQNFAHPDAYEGDEFYLQYRFKVSQQRLLGDRAKLCYLQYPSTSGPAQVFFELGKRHFLEQPLPAEVVPGTTFGQMLYTQAGGGDARQPAGNIMAGFAQFSGSYDLGGTNPWQHDYPLGYYANRNSANCYTFCYQSDVWITMLLHMKLGRDNAEQFHPAGRSSGDSYNPYPRPFPGESDSTFWTLIEVKVHMPGWSDYKTLVNIPNAYWFYGDGLGDVGALVYDAPGISAFWMTQEFNMYAAASGSLCPPDGYADAEFAQPILSRNFIPVPST